MTKYDLEYKKKRINQILFMHKIVFTLPVSFTGSYTEDKPNLPRQNILINFTEKRCLAYT